MQHNSPGPYRGRGGRGRGFISSNRAASTIGGKTVSNVNKISFDPSHPMYEKIKKMMDSEASTSSTQSTYAKILNEEADDIEAYEAHSHEEVILLLENEDSQWKNDPWYLMQRYVDQYNYPWQQSKHRLYYETILKVTDSCDIEHFQSNPNTPIYSYSKIYVKKFLTAKDWGISTLKDREFIIRHDPTKYCYNYWDYVEAFSKVFLYENPKHKHSWWVKFNPEIFAKKHFPNWVHAWWNIHGASVKILPEPFKGLYTEWLSITPHIGNNADDYIEGTSSLYFFMEYGIPWIWKWVPHVGKTRQNIPCLKLKFYSKFWVKLLKHDDTQKKLFGQDLIDEITSTVETYKSMALELKKKEVQKESPFSHILKQIQIRKPMSSKEEIITSYIDEVKKDFIKNFEEADNVSGDASMVSAENPYACLAGESQSQDVQYEDIWESLKDCIIKKFQDDKKAGSSSE